MNVVERKTAGSRQRGFTLAEVMVAMSILALIGGLTYGTFARAMKAREQAAEVTRHYHQIRQAMLRMSREISMAFISTHRDCDDPRTRTIFRVERRGGGDRLHFTSFSNYKMRPDANVSDQNELSYFVGRDPENSDQEVLLRRMDPRIDDEPDEGGKIEVLANNIKSIEFRFYDPKDDEWVDDWDANNQDFEDRLPMFVSIRAEVDGLDGKTEEFVTKTRVFLQQRLRILGTGFSACPDD